MNYLLPILAVIPGLLIVFLIYRLDKYNKEPWKYLAICFILGMISTLPALKLEELGAKMGFDQADHLGYLFLFSFAVVALSEELVKYLCLVLFAYPRKVFDEPLDGIVYAVFIGMGFATLENIFYALQYGIGTTVVRAFTAVPAHGIFAVFMGYFVGLAKFNKAKRKQYLAFGLGMAVLVHGVYDFFIIQEYYEWLMILATLTLFVAGFFAYRLVKRHLRESKSSVENSYSE